MSWLVTARGKLGQHPRSVQHEDRAEALATQLHFLSAGWPCVALTRQDVAAAPDPEPGRLTKLVRYDHDPDEVDCDIQLVRDDLPTLLAAFDREDWEAVERWSDEIMSALANVHETALGRLRGTDYDETDRRPIGGIYG